MFALSCRCGSDRHYVHCYRWANPDFHNQVVILSPLDLECAACRAIAPLLDTDAHGYDAELGHGTATARGQGERVVFECPTCGREPELFTWFNLIGRCLQCLQVRPVADFECA